MTRFPTRIVPMTLLSLASLFAVSLFAADDPPKPKPVTSHWDVGHEVPFDFDRGRITEPLPFDVPFYLLAKVPDSAREPKALIGEKIGGECTPERVQSAAIVKIPKNNGRDTYFEASIDALHPRRDYCFRFEFERERTSEEAKEITARITTVLRNLYQQAEPGRVATLVGGSEFREKLLEAVQQSVKPAIVRVEPGRYLNVSSGFPSLEERQRFEGPHEQLVAAEGHVKSYSKLRPPGVPVSALQPRPTLAEIDAEIVRLGVEIGDARDPAIADDLADASESLYDARNSLLAFERQLATIAAEIEEWIAEQYDLIGTTTAGYEARFSYYVSADLGIGVAPETDDVFNYLGANIYLRPVNKKAPLSGLDFRKRFAFMVGLSEKLSGDGRKGLIDDRPLLLGAGLRLTDHLRFTLGAQIFESDDPDPLVTDRELAATPFASLSIDFDIAQTFKNLFSPLLNPTK